MESRSVWNRGVRKFTCILSINLLALSKIYNGYSHMEMNVPELGEVRFAYEVASLNKSIIARSRIADIITDPAPASRNLTCSGV